VVAVLQQPTSQSKPEAGVAQRIRAQVVDDCGAALTKAAGGSVLVEIGEGGEALQLRETGNGFWETTWTPTAAAENIPLQLSAWRDGLDPSAQTLALSVRAAGADGPPLPIGIVNAASSAQAAPDVAAPGSYVAIYGNGLAAGSAASAPALPLPTTLNGVQFSLGGKAMPLLYASPGQVNALVPQGLIPNSSYPLVALRGSVPSVPVAVIVPEHQPGIYTADTSGSGQGIVTNAITGRLVDADNPAHAGNFLTIYCAGLGVVQGIAPPDGAAVPAEPLFPTTARVTATIGGVDAPVLFSGLTATLAGLYQVNVQVPPGVGGVDVPVVITAVDTGTGFAVRSNSVTIAVR
jgi:uncharacterized protein (TIGR03437 family)